MAALLTALLTACALFTCHRRDNTGRVTAKATVPKESGIRHSAEGWLTRRIAAKKA